MTLAIAPYQGTLVDRSRGWVTLLPDELRRRAVIACRDKDADSLWSLTEAHLATWGKSGARVSQHSLRAYRTGVLTLVNAAAAVSLLDPPRDWGASFVRELEAKGLTPSTVGVRLAAARALYEALRWAGATKADPFRDVHPAKDKTAKWEKRQPYPLEAVEQLLAKARPRDVVLVLLGAHAGLRVGEACALKWEDVDLANGILRVRHGKGDKARTVVLSGRLTAALAGLKGELGASVLGPTERGARAALRRLCARAGVEYRAVHSLRHASGTRLYRQTGDLETVARHLGHASLETARIYAKWSDERLKQAASGW